MYKCPGCGVGLKFDITSQSLKCDYCGNIYPPVEAEESSKSAKEFETNVFICSQCGGEIYTQDSDITGRCSYCGSDIIFENRIKKMTRPARIIPFQKTKDYCKDRYKEMAKRAIFAPKQMRDEEQIDQFRGIYMPFWVYDIERKGEINTDGHRSYQKGRYDCTDYYHLSGSLEANYPNLVHDASSAFSDEISERIVPYQMSENVKDFSTAYLCGFYGEMEDVDADEYLSYMKEITDQDVNSFINNSYGDLSVNPLDPEAIDTRCKKKELFLMPVWFMAWREKERVVYATVNGQTGRATAEFSVDIRRFLAFAGLLTLPIFVLLNFFFTFRAPVTAGLTSIAAFVGMCLFTHDLRMIVRKNTEMAQLQKLLQFSQEEKALIEERRTGSLSLQKFLKIIYTVLMVIVAVLVVFAYLDSDLWELVGLAISGLGSFLQSDHFMTVIAGAMFLCGLVKLGGANKRYRLAKKVGLQIFPGHYCILLSLLITLLIEIIAPASDFIFYGVTVLAMAAILVTLVNLIICHNYIATMPMPQFAHKGGDDRA